MTSSCPECGRDVELQERVSRVHAGHCSGCGHRITLFTEVEATPPSPTASEPSGVTAGSPEGSAEPGADASEGDEEPEGPPCPKCGGVLELGLGEGNRLVGTCSDCESQFTYVMEDGRGERRGRSRRPEPEGASSFGPRARPCRKCGEPLRFSTNPDETVTGTCDACGNTFTLPPRREGRFGDRPGRGPPGRGGGPGRRPWRSGPPQRRGRFDRSDAPRGPGRGPPRRRKRRDEFSD
jgi:hypothetical protein